MTEKFNAVTETLYHSKCYKYDIPPHCYKAGEWCYGSSCTPADISLIEKRPGTPTGKLHYDEQQQQQQQQQYDNDDAPHNSHQHLKVTEIKSGIAHYFTIQPNVIYRSEDSTRYFILVAEEGSRIGIGFKKREDSAYFLSSIKSMLPRIAIYTHEIEESLFVKYSHHHQYQQKDNSNVNSNNNNNDNNNTNTNNTNNNSTNNINNNTNNTNNNNENKNIVNVTIVNNGNQESNDDIEVPAQMPDIRSNDYLSLPSGRFTENFAAASTTPSVKGEVPKVTVLEGDNDVEVTRATMPNSSETGESSKEVVGRKHSDEDISQIEWRKHRKHIFVLSIAGKPIYTRYGDDQKLAPFMASMMALISFVEDSKDNIRYFAAGNLKVVFFVRGPMYLGCISRNKEDTVAELSRQLFFVHSQIVSTLTFGTITKILSKRPDFDLRGLLTDTDLVIDNLMRKFSHHLGLALGAVQPLPLRPETRTKIENAFLEAACPELLFAMLFTDFSLIHLACPRKISLNPIDIYMVMNFVNSSTSFRISTTSWTPICLPVFDSKGFLHAYVYYIAANMCLVMLSTKVDSFYNINEAAKKFTESLERQDAMKAMMEACSRPQYRIKELTSPGLRHFALKSILLKQVTAPALMPPDNTPSRQKRLFKIYQTLHSAADRPANGLVNKTQTGAHKIYYIVNNTESAIVWTTNDFELYAVFSPLESKASVVKCCNKIISYVLGHESDLFITNIPILPFKA